MERASHDIFEPQQTRALPAGSEISTRSPCPHPEARRSEQCPRGAARAPFPKQAERQQRFRERACQTQRAGSRGHPHRCDHASLSVHQPAVPLASMAPQADRFTRVPPGARRLHRCADLASTPPAHGAAAQAPLSMRRRSPRKPSPSRRVRSPLSRAPQPLRRHPLRCEGRPPHAPSLIRRLERPPRSTRRAGNISRRELCPPFRTLRAVRGARSTGPPPGSRRGRRRGRA